MKVLAKCSSVLCELDPIHTKILYKCIRLLSPVLTKRTNISLKTERVKPFKKLLNTDLEQLKKMQSAYRSGHSTETALLRMKNNILMTIDNRKAVVLVLLGRGLLGKSVFLIFKVPLGSVLGPVLFIICTLPLARIPHRHGLHIHRYANDTQLYASYDITDMEQTQDVIV